MTANPRLTPSVLAWLRQQPARVQYEFARRLRQPIPPPRTRPPPTDPGTRPPPVDPPPPTSGYPVVTEQVWKPNPYMTLWGGWNVPQTAYGKEWGATGEGPGHPNGPILVDSYGQGMHVGKILQDCRIVGLGLHPTSKFCERIYNQINPVRRKCEYLGHLPEHYIYPSVHQGGLLEDVRFGALNANNACGSAWHWAMRNIIEGTHDYTMETQQAELSQVESTRIFRRVEFNHIGNPYQSDGVPSGRWGAFNLEEIWAQLQINGEPVGTVNTHIRMESCKMIGGHLNWIDPNGTPVKSARGFVVQGRPSLTQTDCYFNMPMPYSGWLGRINGVQHVEIRNGEYQGGEIEITDAQTIAVVGVTGTTKLSVKQGGATVWAGTVAQGYSKGVK